jgi:hypothetical protein
MACDDVTRHCQMRRHDITPGACRATWRHSPCWCFMMLSPAGIRVGVISCIRSRLMWNKITSCIAKQTKLMKSQISTIWFYSKVWWCFLHHSIKLHTSTPGYIDEKRAAQCMVESPVFVAEQFSWYICFGIKLIFLDQISRVFTRNIKDSLFYNVPENFASIDKVFSPWEAKIGMVIKISMSADRKSKIFTPPQNTPLKKHFFD